VSLCVNNDDLRNPILTRGYINN